MKTIHCPDLVSFFATKNTLEEKGLIYIKNQKVPESRGSNYICVDDMGLFALISKQDFETLNEECNG